MRGALKQCMLSPLHVRRATTRCAPAIATSSESEVTVHLRSAKLHSLGMVRSARGRHAKHTRPRSVEVKLAASEVREGINSFKRRCVRWRSLCVVGVASFGATSTHVFASSRLL